jgi:hypothetical protein
MRGPVILGLSALCTLWDVLVGVTERHWLILQLGALLDGGGCSMKVRYLVGCLLMNECLRKDNNKNIAYYQHFRAQHYCVFHVTWRT